MRKKDGRGGDRYWELCNGSATPPARQYGQVGIQPDDWAGKPKGRCGVCGRICTLNRKGNMPRHKPLSDVVRSWEKERQEE